MFVSMVDRYGRRCMLNGIDDGVGKGVCCLLFVPPGMYGIIAKENVSGKETKELEKR